MCDEQSMTAEIAPQWFQVSEDFILDPPPSWEELRSGMKRNLRESLRHCSSADVRARCARKSPSDKLGSRRHWN